MITRSLLYTIKEVIERDACFTLSTQHILDIIAAVERLTEGLEIIRDDFKYGPSFVASGILKEVWVVKNDQKERIMPILV